MTHLQPWSPGAKGMQHEVGHNAFITAPRWFHGRAMNRTQLVSLAARSPTPHRFGSFHTEKFLQHSPRNIVAETKGLQSPLDVSTRQTAQGLKTSAPLKGVACLKAISTKHLGTDRI